MNDKSLRAKKNPQKKEDLNDSKSSCSWVTVKSKKEDKTSTSFTLKLTKSQLLILEEIEKSCGISRDVKEEDVAIEPRSGGNSASRKGQESSLLIENESMKKKDISVEIKKKKRKSTVEKTDVESKKLRLDTKQNLSKKSSSKASDKKSKQKSNDKTSSKRKRSSCFEKSSSKSGSFFTNPSSVSSVSFFAEEDFDVSMYPVLRQSSEEELKAREELTEKWAVQQALMVEQGLDYSEGKELNILYSNINEVRVAAKIENQETMTQKPVEGKSKMSFWRWLLNKCYKK